MEDSGNQVMYHLSDVPERAFLSEELMLIPKDTELPLDYFQKWSDNTYPTGYIFLHLLVANANGDCEWFLDLENS